MEDPVSLLVSAIKVRAFSSGMRLGERTFLPVLSLVRIVVNVHIKDTYIICCQRIRYRNTETGGAVRTSDSVSYADCKQLPVAQKKKELSSSPTCCSQNNLRIGSKYKKRNQILTDGGCSPARTPARPCSNPLVDRRLFCILTTPTHREARGEQVSLS